MKLNVTGGRVVHSPLSFSFQMVELGGSAIQKYNTLTGDYEPDRGITQYYVKPKLGIHDPDALIPDGDYASALTNVSWGVYMSDGKKTTKITSEAKKTFEVDTINGLTLYMNVPTGNILHLEFSADYYNATRDESSHFTWQKDLTTQDLSEVNISMEVKTVPSGKLNMWPWKKYGKFPIETQLKNGTEDIDDEKCVYQWQVLEDSQWRDIDPEYDVWYESGKDSKTLVVDQDYLDRVMVRIVAYAKGFQQFTQSKALLIRRWYGKWEDVPYFATGKFIMKDTTRAIFAVKVVNYSGGNISNPERYFDIEMFYRPNEEAEWQSQGNGTEAVLTRQQLTANHQAADICRELTANQPTILPDGSYLADENGALICSQFPTTEKEVE